MSDTLVNRKNVKIRKSHRCHGCAEVFPVGSIMGLMRVVDSSEFLTSYWCVICQKVWDKYMRAGDEIDMGELKEYYPEEYKLPKGDRK